MITVFTLHHILTFSIDTFLKCIHYYQYMKAKAFWSLFYPCITNIMIISGSKGLKSRKFFKHIIKIIFSTHYISVF